MKRFREKWQQSLALRRQRQQLLAMDERTRKDLAISRVDAEQLAGRYGILENNGSEGRDKAWKK